ncbi:hypothetical protein GIB67_013886 [Kingdonia uniflora]|uniref:Uncharacterized protein n=1 Tax=Kingdonia uniflora TaxID=39325 RepID=A0A7J7LD91_9MAGN|nr:hypothetical protein GIB67_013886 [Kingdonia uniflora]
MVDDDVKVGREVNFNTMSSEYGGDLLENFHLFRCLCSFYLLYMKWKKGEENDNDDKKDVEEKVKSEEEKVQVMEESNNGDEKVDDVVEEVDSEQPTVVVYYTGKKDVQHDNKTMVVAEVAKTDIVFFNQKEVVGEAYQASANQTTDVYVKEQTLEAEKTEDEASQASTDQIINVSVVEQTIEVAQTEVVVSYQEEDVGEGSQLILMESEVDVTSKKGHALTEEENNESAFKMACRMNQLYAHLDELLSGVLLESFIQRPISHDEKSLYLSWLTNDKLLIPNFWLYK